MDYFYIKKKKKIKIEIVINLNVDQFLFHIIISMAYKSIKKSKNTFKKWKKKKICN